MPATKRETVELPEWVWGRLATIADHRGVHVADLIADGIYHVLGKDPARLAQLQTELQKHKSRKKAAKKTTGPYATEGDNA